MKIAHLCLSNFFIDDYGYQENELVRQHVSDGHDVMVLASTESIGEDGKVFYLEPSQYLGVEGAEVVRLPYRSWLPHKLVRKLRTHPGVFKQLEKFDPDVILFHSLCGWELLTVSKYKRCYPKVKVYADSHEDQYNSGRTFLSLELLHKRYYGPILRRSLPAIEKILCLSLEVMDFVHEVYKIPLSHLEFYPLGGHPKSDERYETARTNSRSSLGFTANNIVFLQSGKLTKRKKLLESLRAFSTCPNKDYRLLIIGILFEDIREEAEELIEKDDRIRFLGWKSADELTQLLSGADIYLQPGTQSVTMQYSLCARCAIIVDEVKSHSPYMNNNGWYVNAERDLEQIFLEVESKRNELGMMQKNSYELACQLLDYKILAARILESD